MKTNSKYIRGGKIAKPALMSRAPFQQPTVIAAGLMASVIGIFVILRIFAATNTYYASPSGSGSTCTSSAPCDFLTALDQVFAGGGEMVAKDGTYSFSNYLYGVNNSVTNSVTIRSETKYGAKLIFAGAAAGNFATYFFGNNITMKDFDVSGSVLAGGINMENGSGSIIGNRVHDISTGVCSQTGGIEVGKRVNANGPNPNAAPGPYLIDSNVVYNIGDASMTSCNTLQGIYTSVEDALVQNNVISNVASYCLHSWHDTATVNYRNNSIDHCGSGGILVGSGDVVVSQHIVRGRIDNNTVRDSAYCIREYAGEIGAITYHNNNCYNNSLNTPEMLARNRDGAINYQVGLTQVNPGYMNYPSGLDPLANGGNYALAAGSGLINAGYNGNAPTSDIMGGARPNGATVDVGAYEYGSTSTSTTPTPAATASPAPTPTPNQQAQAAFKLHSVPGRIEAEDFDIGGEGVAYHDADPTQTGNNTSYRAGEGVGISDETAGTDNGSRVVGRIRAGEWTEYTVNMPSTDASYSFTMRLANPTAGGVIKLQIGDGGLLDLASIIVPNTGAWETFQTTTPVVVSLPAGQHIVHLLYLTEAAGGGVADVNWFEFTSTNQPTPTPSPTATPAPSITPKPTPTPTPLTTTKPTATPVPTAVPTPTPTPTCTKLGDVNCDGKVNNGDLNTVLHNYGKSVTTRAQGDLTGDGVVNIFDLSQVLQNWGR